MTTIFYEDQYVECPCGEFDGTLEVRSLGREQFEWVCPECGQYVVNDRGE